MDTWEHVIRSQRKALGLSQPAVAKECDVAVNTVWNWEHGVAEPNAHHQRKLVRLLGIDPITLHRIYTRETAA